MINIIINIILYIIIFIINIFFTWFTRSNNSEMAKIYKTLHYCILLTHYNSLLKINLFKRLLIYLSSKM